MANPHAYDTIGNREQAAIGSADLPSAPAPALTTYTPDNLNQYDSISIGGAGGTTGVTAGAISFTSRIEVKNLLGHTTSVQTADENGDGILETTTVATDIPNRSVTTTDPLGNTRVSTKYRDGRAKAVSGTAVHAMTYDYGRHSLNGGGEWSKTILANGTEWTQTHSDLLGRVIRTTHADGNYADRSYFPHSATIGARGKLKTARDADERLTAGSGTRVDYAYGYNANGQPFTTATEKLPGNQTKVTTTTAGVVATVTFHGTDLVPAAFNETKVNGIVISTSYRSGDGYLSGSIALGQESLTVRSIPTATTDGNWTVTATTPDGQQSKQTYADSRLEKAEFFDNTATLVSSTSTTYDSLGRTASMTDSRTGTVSYSGVANTGYTPSGNLLGVDDHGRLTTSTYDQLGRRLTTSRITNNPSPVTHTTYTAYHKTGEVKAQWGSQTYPRWYHYNSQGRLQHLYTYTSDPNFGTDPLALGDTAPAGNAQTTTWLYSSTRGWLGEKQDDDGKGANYTYTASGRLKTRVWERGITTTYGYDQGKLAAITYTGETNGHTTPNLAYTYDNYGRLLTVTRGGTLHAAYAYDPDDLVLTAERQQIDGLNRTVVRAYDDHLRPEGHTAGLPDSTDPFLVATPEVSANSTRDDAGRLATVSNGTDTFTYGYVPDSTILLGTVTGPVHTVANTWESTLNVLDVKANTLNAGPANLSTYDYEVNALGQRESVATSGGAFQAPSQIDWNYDDLGQVVSADHSTTNAHDRAYAYDTIGNREQSAIGSADLPSAPAPALTTYTPDNLNQYDSVTIGGASGTTLNPVHDDDGNMTSGPLPGDPTSNATLTWDAENRLVKVEMPASGPVVTYAYDHLSRLITRTQITSNQSQVTSYL